MGLVRLRPATPAETRWTKIIVIGLALYISCMYLTNYILTKRIVSGKGLEKTLVRMYNEALRHYGRKEVVGDVYDYTCKAVHHSVYTHECTAVARLQDGSTSKLCIVRDFPAYRGTDMTMTVTMCDIDPKIEIKEVFYFSRFFFDYPTEAGHRW